MKKWQPITYCLLLVIQLVTNIWPYDYFPINKPKNPFTYELINNDTTMPYVLYTPTTSSDGPIPLIIWLHGYNNGSTDKEVIDNNGLPCALSQWELDGFDAYIVCPQLVGKWNITPWFTDTTKENVEDIVSTMIETYNIDTNRIVISGHSNGGMGAIYMASTDTHGYYSKIVQISGCGVGVDMSPIKSIDARGYVGHPSYGELMDNYYYTTTTYSDLAGSENIFVLQTGHAEVAVDAFLLDKNNDNKSDLIEWMLK